MDMDLEKLLIKIITNDPERSSVLKSVSELNLPEAWIAGGYIRNPVWDHIYKKEHKTCGTDVDVVYFRSLDTYGMPEAELIGLIKSEKTNPVWSEEDVATKALTKKFPHLQFEIKNQARMYFSSARTVTHEKYNSLSDAIRGWVETATATGLRLHRNKWEVLAPFGLEDLFAGIVRPPL